MTLPRLSDFSSGTRSAVVRLALAGGGTARITMRGISMAPHLRDGMVLELRALTPKARIGDILVFEAGRRLVAHRVIGFDGDVLLCSGDAQPDSVERVTPDACVGRVVAVRDSFGNRIDTRRFWILGRLRALLRPVRARLVQLSPSMRPRTYAVLAQVMAAIVRADDDALRCAIAKERPSRLAYVAKRHRCAAAISAALERIKDDDHAVALQARLKVERWSAFMQASRLRLQIQQVLTILRDAGIEPVFLKGAQRALAGDDRTRIFNSVDIDVLVSPQQAPEACRALEGAGYRRHTASELLEFYRNEHHHEAPLYPPSGVPVEVHRSLAPYALGVPYEWDQLQPYIGAIETPYGPVKVLDAIGTALHLAIHAIHRPALREIVLLAQHLRTLNDFELRRLRGLLARESRYRIRVDAAVTFAAELAGIAWPVEATAQRYADWMKTREELPRPLRRRTFCVDAYFGEPKGRVSAALRASWPDGPGGYARKAITAAARLAAALTIAAYAPAMRSKDRVY